MYVYTLTMSLNNRFALLINLMIISAPRALTAQWIKANGPLGGVVTSTGGLEPGMYLCSVKAGEVEWTMRFVMVR
jgi:hypothetical protein